MCFVVQPAQEHREERERVGQLEGETLKAARHWVEMGMQSLEERDYSVRGSASLKAHCSWNRDGVGCSTNALGFGVLV